MSDRESSVIIVGSFAGILTTICAIPQLVTILKHHSAKDVSLLTFLTMFISEILWIIYGYQINDLQIIITNAICTFLTFCILFFGILFRYKNNTFLQPKTNTEPIVNLDSESASNLESIVIELEEVKDP